MCQVTPFRLPCCQRIYVSVDRLPSCPDGWPRKKCPKELCVQISGFVPGHIETRKTGVCWRCVASYNGVDYQAREGLRPVLDKAYIVEGLGEVSIEERRSKIEKAGLCWHCGAHGDCATCGTGSQAENSKDTLLDGWDHKGKRKASDDNSGQRRSKILKAQHSRGSMPTLNSTFPVSSASSAKNPFEYPPQAFEHLESSSSVVAVPGYPNKPFGPQQTEAAPQQYHFNTEQTAYDQFHQPAPHFNYQTLPMSFETPISRNLAQNRQEIESFQAQGTLRAPEGSMPVDPTLEPNPKEDESKKHVVSTLARPLDPGFVMPPLPEFDTSWIDDKVNAMDDETFRRIFEPKSSDMKIQSPNQKGRSPETKVLNASQSTLVDRSIGPSRAEYPSPP